MIYVYEATQGERYAQLLAKALPHDHVSYWPHGASVEDVEYAVVWNPPPGFFAAFPSLKAVFSLGAGVNTILARDDLEPGIPVVRLSDAGMAQQMTEYVQAGVLIFQRKLVEYRLQQLSGQWQPIPAKLASETRITVLGMGAIGQHVALALVQSGYQVAGWSRTRSRLPGVNALQGVMELEHALAQTDALVNLLPSTPETKKLLTRDRLQRLPKGSGFINAGRGDLVDGRVLLECLDSGRLGFAMLDVFEEEPLPVEHPLWNHPAVLLTPHIAAVTLPEQAVEQIASNIHRHRIGEDMIGVVDRLRGY